MGSSRGSEDREGDPRDRGGRLEPEDYHLATIEKIEEQRGHATTAELEADLDLLLTDAIAAALDHVRYGKIRRGSWTPLERRPP